MLSLSRVEGRTTTQRQREKDTHGGEERSGDLSYTHTVWRGRRRTQTHASLFPLSANTHPVATQTQLSHGTSQHHHHTFTTQAACRGTQHRHTGGRAAQTHTDSHQPSSAPPSLGRTDPCIGHNIIHIYTVLERKHSHAHHMQHTHGTPHTRTDTAPHPQTQLHHTHTSMQHTPTAPTPSMPHPSLLPLGSSHSKPTPPLPSPYSHTTPHHYTPSIFTPPSLSTPPQPSQHTHTTSLSLS
ncbi:hypothetical protein LOK49_LG01G00180 [Camellia lanceoleosa]|uniref:Uncharacterized protein n=1 Tax=Camellia lanceoleosa TaxID=1840588 RepID=A0ACC0IZB8_9ERIC|nr:hypothetical protein LOK49_LG01G00180 [Camellia lanceoleosa]